MDRTMRTSERRRPRRVLGLSGLHFSPQHPAFSVFSFDQQARWFFSLGVPDVAGEKTRYRISIPSVSSASDCHLERHHGKPTNSLIKTTPPPSAKRGATLFYHSAAINQTNGFAKPERRKQGRRPSGPTCRGVGC